MICCNILIIKEGSINECILFYGETNDTVAKEAEEKFKQTVRSLDEEVVLNETEWQDLLDEGHWSHESLYNTSVSIIWPDATYVTSGKFETITKIDPIVN